MTAPRAVCSRCRPIIVPNRNIATYLKYEIARRAGIAAGLTFQMTEEFLETLLHQTKAESPPELVNTATLRALFIDVLSEESESARPLPDAVRTYIAAGGDGRDARDLRRFQLGSRLAALARQYGNYRPDWLQPGPRVRPRLRDGPLASTEEWQRDLWARLIEHVTTQADRARELGLAVRAVRLP